MAEVIDELSRHLDDITSIHMTHTSDGREFYAQICAPFELYALTRLLRPSHVVEAGVSSGVSSSHFLLGLLDNGAGALHSIDMPTLQKGPELAKGESPVSLPPDRSPGWAVPQELTLSWDLRIGPSESLLPGLVESIPTVDLFLHDDLHTATHLTFELEAIRPKLHDGSVVLADNTKWTGKAFDRFAASFGAEIESPEGLRPSRAAGPACGASADGRRCGERSGRARQSDGEPREPGPPDRSPGARRRGPFNRPLVLFRRWRRAARSRSDRPTNPARSKGVGPVEEARQRWEEEVQRPGLARSPERKDRFETLGGIPVDRLYTPTPAPRTTGSATPASSRTRGGSTRRCTGAASGRCGCSPGSGPPRTPTPGSDTSSTHGESGLSIAFDDPTLYGIDAGRPRGARRGRRSAASTSRRSRTWSASSGGSPLERVTTSMTINGAGEHRLGDVHPRGRARGDRMGGARRNDPERHPEGVHRPEASPLPPEARP